MTVAPGPVAEHFNVIEDIRPGQIPGLYILFLMHYFLSELKHYSDTALTLLCQERAIGNVGCVRDGINTLTVHFDSPWYPPAGEVIGRVSELFSCQVEHTWYMPDAERSGYDRYDRGEHVDGGRIAAKVEEGEVIHLTYAD